MVQRLGPATVTATAGLAFFTGLAVHQAGSGYTIQVTTSDNSLTPTTTTAFNVTAAAASQLVISQQPPSNVIAGDPFGLSFSVQDPTETWRQPSQARSPSLWKQSDRLPALRNTH